MPLDSELHSAAERFEFKYRVPRCHYHAIRNAIRPFMKQDYYTQRSNGDGYFVRSLYYESPSGRIYAEKLSGDCARVKYRLRSYTDQPNSATIIRAEMKVRRGETLSKYNEFVPVEVAHNFIERKCWGNHKIIPILEEFARGVHLQCLNPTILIDYWREGYESRLDDDVRLTFDHRVCSAHERVLFPVHHPFFRVHHQGEIVLEIKYRKMMPEWIGPIIRAFGLRTVANSKFTQGIEVGRRDRHFPGGVQVVR